MPVPFPSASIAVVNAGFVLFAAVLTDKNPGFSLLNLHPEQGGVFCLAGGA